MSLLKIIKNSPRGSCGKNVDLEYIRIGVNKNCKVLAVLSIFGWTRWENFDFVNYARPEKSLVSPMPSIFYRPALLLCCQNCPSPTGAINKIEDIAGFTACDGPRLFTVHLFCFEPSSELIGLSGLENKMKTD